MQNSRLFFQPLPILSVFNQSIFHSNATNPMKCFEKNFRSRSSCVEKYGDDHDAIFAFSLEKIEKNVEGNSNQRLEIIIKFISVQALK